MWFNSTINGEPYPGLTSRSNLLEIKECSFIGAIRQVLHGCRQLVPWGVRLSPLTSATHRLYVTMFHRETALVNNREEGEDDVKSAWPLCLGPHTCYNGMVQRVANPRGGANLKKPYLSSDCRSETRPAWSWNR